ncbi:MAG: hypothetical protein ACJAUP_003045, partial [Cellvibrionaceae bacterium]
MFNEIRQISRQTIPTQDRTMTAAANEVANSAATNIALGLNNSSDNWCLCIPNPFSRKDGNNVFIASSEQSIQSLQAEQSLQ